MKASSSGPSETLLSSDSVPGRSVILAKLSISSMHSTPTSQAPTRLSGTAGQPSASYLMQSSLPESGLKVNDRTCKKNNCQCQNLRVSYHFTLYTILSITNCCTPNTALPFSLPLGDVSPFTSSIDYSRLINLETVLWISPVASPEQYHSNNENIHFTVVLCSV